MSKFGGNRTDLIQNKFIGSMRSKINVKRQSKIKCEKPKDEIVELEDIYQIDEDTIDYTNPKLVDETYNKFCEIPILSSRISAKNRKIKYNIN